MFRIGIVGSNLYGKAFAAAIADTGGAAAVALCPDLDEPLEPLASSYGLRAYPHLESMLQSAKLDAAVLASVTAHHERQALLAFGAGVHVFVDRPIATTRQAAARMLDAARASRRVLMVGHVLQFWPEYATIRNMLCQGDLGEPTVVTASRVSGLLDLAWQSRLLNPAYGLGVLEAHLHDIDFLIGTLGEPQIVSACGGLQEGGAWVHVHSLLRFQGGCRAGVEADYSVPCNFPLTMYLRVVGDRGAVMFTRSGALAARTGAQRSLTLFREGVSPTDLDVPATDPFKSMLGHFVDCARQGKEPDWGNGRQAVAALGVIEAISRTAAANRLGGQQGTEEGA